MSRFGIEDPSEVDKAELTLDSTKRNLEAVILEGRNKDRQIELEREKNEKLDKDLQMANIKIATLEDKMEDLKIQVRYELMKNETIERGLETIPRLKEDIKDKDKKLDDLQKEVEEKTVLLNASRKSAREYKEKLREFERNDVETICVKEELEIAKSEVDTLKRLMSGKDVLVQQKCHALEQARTVMSKLGATATSDVEKQRLRQIQNALDQLKQIHHETCGGPEVRSSLSNKGPHHNRFAQSRPKSAMSESNRGEIDINNPPYNTATANGKENSHLDNGLESPANKSSTYLFLERFLDDTEGLSNKQKRPKTSNGSTPSPRVHRSSSFHQLNNHNHDNNNSHSHNHTNGGNAESSFNRRANNRRSSGELLDRKKAKSSQSIHHTTSPTPQSANSPRKPKSFSTTTMFLNAAPQPCPNVYACDKNTTKQSQYQPSLEYCLGISTDDDLTTDTSHCQSAPHNTKHQQQQPNNRPSSRPKSAFSISVSKRGHSTGSDSESGSHDTYTENGTGHFSNQQLLTLSRLSGSEKDAILDQVIQIGDRVSIQVNQKPPRYGKKKPKPVTYTGIVKYKGLLDSQNYDARIYVGLRLDAPLGDSDGSHKGKRYMFTPKNHAKFFKIRDLDTVLDVNSSVYVTTSRLILAYLERQTIQDAIIARATGQISSKPTTTSASTPSPVQKTATTPTTTTLDKNGFV